MKTTINKKMRVITVALLLSGLVPSTMMAQDKVEASVGADLVSGYIWRGQNLGGISVQPSLGISYKGLSLGAWGSVGIESKDAKEFDLTLGYSIGGFSVSITDYWFDKTYTGDVDEYGKEIYTTNKYFQYGAYSTAHVFEAQVGYDFGPLAVNWYTNFAGADGVKENGKRAYSSYLALSAPFKLGGQYKTECGKYHRKYTAVARKMQESIQVYIIKYTHGEKDYSVGKQLPGQCNINGVVTHS